MDTYLNFHAHRPAVSSSETVIRNLPVFFPGNQDKVPVGNEWFSAGIHPWYIPENYKSVLTELDEWWHSPYCVAIGEIGLDKSVDVPFPLQREVFLHQFELAEKYGIPVVLHCVRAWGELLEVQKEAHSSVPCVVHGFRGAPALAGQLLDKGFYLSFGFRFNVQTLLFCPSDRLFLETDEDNRSVEELYRSVALLRRCSKIGLADLCWQNFSRFRASSL